MDAASNQEVAEAASMFVVAIGTLATAWLVVEGVRNACPPPQAALVETLPRAASVIDPIAVRSVVLSNSNERRDVRASSRLDVTTNDVVEIRGRATSGHAARDVFAAIDDRTYRIATAADDADPNGSFVVALPMTAMQHGTHHATLRLANSNLTSYTEAAYHVDLVVH